MKKFVSKKEWIVILIVLLAVAGIIIPITVTRNNRSKPVSDHPSTEGVPDNPKTDELVPSVEATPEQSGANNPDEMSENIDDNDNQPFSELDKDVYKDVSYEINTRLREDMPNYRFVASGVTQSSDEGAIGYVMGLEIFDENNTLILSEDFSEIIGDEVIGYPAYNEMMDTMGLHVVDVNFDGDKDVIILNNFAGAHGNTWYDCWLWDANTSSFVASDSFAAICNPALDPVNKCIYSAGGSGAAYWGGMIYQFIDGEFVVTNELDTDWDGLVEKKLVNGKMEIVREVQYGDNDQIVSDEQEYYKNSELWQLDHPRWYWGGGHHADQWLE